ncbi:hypothetical protein ABIA30_003187 [Mycobacterium sp. MAA66]|uniref:hypothetical protein n=1 Tax=Mycobacterium sp. MAA66 TaxID=3156297 RepID=UPI003512FA54
MNRAAAAHVSDRTASPGLPMSAADRKQAELFAALLGEHREQIAADIRSTAAAIAHHQDSGDALSSHRLRQAFRHMSRAQNELDLLCHSVRRRLSAEVLEVTKLPRHFDITVKRRRTGWRMEIPTFGVVLANIDSRAEAEAIGRSIIAAVTGLPAAAIVVHPLVG